MSTVAICGHTPQGKSVAVIMLTTNDRREVDCVLEESTSDTRPVAKSPPIVRSGTATARRHVVARASARNASAMIAICPSAIA
jgi:hypothetical protein